MVDLWLTISCDTVFLCLSGDMNKASFDRLPHLCSTVLKHKAPHLWIAHSLCLPTVSFCYQVRCACYEHHNACLMKLLFYAEGLEGIKPTAFILRPERNAVSPSLYRSRNSVHHPVSWAGIRIKKSMLQMYAKHPLEVGVLHYILQVPFEHVHLSQLSSVPLNVTTLFVL
jgi:hypothetical protein